MENLKGFIILMKKVIMGINTEVFKIIDNEKECLRINVTGTLSGVEAAALRTAVEQGLKSEFDTIYIDFKKLTDSGLPAVNEVIHAHYTLAEAAKKLVLVYIKGGAIEKWVETTGLDKFVATAILFPD
jgi:hypothetical protein